MKKIVFLSLISILILLSSCTGKTSTTSTQYKNFTPTEAKQLLSEDKNAILLDVRTMEEHEEKYIPNSIVIPVDDLEKQAPVKLTNKNASIIIYCRSGNRSVTAAKTLIKLGYTKVYNLGGINDWPYETVSDK